MLIQTQVKTATKTQCKQSSKHSKQSKISLSTNKDKPDKSIPQNQNLAAPNNYSLFLYFFQVSRSFFVSRCDNFLFQDITSYTNYCFKYLFLIFVNISNSCEKWNLSTSFDGEYYLPKHHISNFKILKYLLDSENIIQYPESSHYFDNSNICVRLPVEDINHYYFYLT